ncbi:rod shape-determining protein MreC [Collinsella tanakaei]|uniref:rod shape-determining protein MreC n=1 Tax=Collinsella tanakaei TaxID=626935 RepID=UPI00195E79A2|nr:rod shape-determining protein MreC [Collinsella tanakaei]MBM6868819.1 rod shape-determining protein MreC [Collinsella tanakaei]
MIVLCVLSVLLLTFYIREGDTGPIHAVRSGVVTVTSPLKMAGSVIASPFNALGNIFSNLTASQETLSDLRDQNAELTAKVAELSEAQETATRLEALVGLQSTYNLQSTAARIIGGSSDAWTQTVTIDKGSADGFTVGMPVCNAYGVIGQITECALNVSTVLLINDETSGVAAMIQSSRAQGMLRGQPDGSLRLEYVPAEAEVKVGDIVITSGIGGVFPKGLPLGTVTSVEKSDNDVYYTISVRTQSSTENNEEVLVITSLNADQVATDEDVAQANDAATAAASDGDSGESDNAAGDSDGSGQDSTADENDSGTDDSEA